MKTNTSYRLLPFRFHKLNHVYLLVSETGQFHYLVQDDLKRLVRGELPAETTTFNDLKAKDIICLKYSAPMIKALAAKYRTKKKHIFDSTALHMLVLTYKCNQQCSYCHASSETKHSGTVDMPVSIARKCLDFAFESPSPYLKIEFQGGEPSLNIETLKFCVEYGKLLAKELNKSIEFVLCTNLYELDEKLLTFIDEQKIQISTSLDGPKDLHDLCRRRGPHQGSYDEVKNNILRIQNKCTEPRLNALLTVSRHNLKHLDRIINEYISLGLKSIFIRMLNPFGRADKAWSELGYDVKEFITEYINSLEYIIEINKNGTFFVEEYAAILLRRILTPFPCGFVDLQSPAGTATSGLIYDTDGDIFVSDEARMIKKASGDKHFCLGNVTTHNRSAAFHADILKNIENSSVIEALPGCAWCAYQAYCGSDPVRNYHLFGDYVSFKPNDQYCQLHKSLFDYLFSKLESLDNRTEAIIWSWLTGIGPNLFLEEQIHEDL